MRKFHGFAQFCPTFLSPPLPPLTSKTTAYLDPLSSERPMGPPENIKIDRAREICEKTSFYPYFCPIIHRGKLEVVIYIRPERQAQESWRSP